MPSSAALVRCSHAQASTCCAGTASACLNTLHTALPAHAEINALLTCYWVEVDKHGNPDGHTAFPAARRPSTWPLAWPRHAPPPKRLGITYTGGAPQPGQPHGLVLFLGRCMENASAASLLQEVQELSLGLQVCAVCVLRSTSAP
jgi:hypothetical protein